MKTDKDKVVSLLASKKVVFATNREDTTTPIDLHDGTYGKIHFSAEGKLVGVTRTVKASLAKAINRAVYG